jgi:hypothetical protein
VPRCCRAWRLSCYRRRLRRTNRFDFRVKPCGMVSVPYGGLFNFRLQVHVAIQRAARDALSGHVTNLAQTRGGAARAAATAEEEGKLAAPVEMLAQLLACVGERGVAVSHAHSNGTGCGHGHGHGHGGGGCGSGSCGSKANDVKTKSHGCGGHAHNHAQSRAASKLRSAQSAALLAPYHAEAFHTLRQFAVPFALDVQAAGAEAVNPFAAVKATFAAENAPVSAEGSAQTEGSSAQFLAPAATVQAIVASMSAMREIVLRYWNRLAESMLCGTILVVWIVFCL